MDPTIQILRVLLPVLYALAAANSVVAFVTRNALASRAAAPLLIVTVTVHALALGLRAATARQCPLGTVFEAMNLTAFSLTAVHVLIQLLRGARPTGILVLPLAFLLVLVAAFFPAEPAKVSPHLSRSQ